MRDLRLGVRRAVVEAYSNRMFWWEAAMMAQRLVREGLPSVPVLPHYHQAWLVNACGVQCFGWAGAGPGVHVCQRAARGAGHRPHLAVHRLRDGPHSVDPHAEPSGGCLFMR